MSPEVTQRLAQKGLFAAPGVHLHTPFSFVPPVRLFGGVFSSATKLDAFSYVAPAAQLHAVHVGRYCSIGDHVSVLSAHPMDRLTTHPFTYESIFGSPFVQPDIALRTFESKMPVTRIGHDVWVGAGVKIKAGVTLGDGCVVAAGSVVTKNVAPYSVVGGVPAQLIKMRFDPAVIARMQRLQWWRFNWFGHVVPWDDLQASLVFLEDAVQGGRLQPYAPAWVSVQSS